ncbi:hypothetical protein C0R09_06275 [Brevibacillus laterosporus]|nr:hypothetical protein C0R09_06275 [Brevibacillus laterosporus]
MHLGFRFCHPFVDKRAGPSDASFVIYKVHLRDKNPEGQVSLEHCYSSALSFWVFLFFKNTLLQMWKGAFGYS